MSDFSEFHLRMPKELHASIKELALESGVSLNYLLVDMIRLMVDSRRFVLREKVTENGVEYEIYVPENWFSRESNTGQGLAYQD